MSGRWLAAILLLAVLSAAIGAGAAILLRGTPADPPAAPTAAVATTMPAETAASQAQQSSSAESSVEVVEEQAAPVVPVVQAQASDPEPEPVIQSEPEPAIEVPNPVQAQQSEPVAVDSIEDETSADFVLAPSTITQGEAVALTVITDDLSTTAAAATLDGRSWTLSQTATGVWWGLAAVARDASVGARSVVVDLYSDVGWSQTVSAELIVLSSTAPLEEIVLGGDGSGDPVDPAELQRDIDVRFRDHVAVSGPARWSGPWQLPIAGEVTGVFGAPRTYDGVPSSEWHHGHDIAGQHGDPLVAPAPGTVVWTGEVVLHGMGVILDHGAGVYSGYWHMSLIAVREGMEVAAGDWIGNVGTTGLSTGPHVHWEVIVQGIDVDPVQWLGDDQPPLPPRAESAESGDTLG